VPPTRDIERIARPDAPIFAPSTRASRSRPTRWARRFAIAMAVLLVVVIAAPRVTTWVLARGEVVHHVSDLPKLGAGDRRAAIVLGAGLKNKQPSPLLADRIDAAVDLLRNDRVDLLLMSGDNTTQYYDEPSAMRRAAIQDGAPANVVAPDYAGRRTWDTCMRARQVFGIKHAVVVTSAFHIDRAVVSCRAAGIDVVGYSVPDGRFSPRHRAVWRTRELAATGRALLDAWVLKPAPAVGGDRIDPYQPCQLYASLAPSVREEAATDFARFHCS
jgi:vancomycin permeability regulator SanA